MTTKLTLSLLLLLCGLTTMFGQPSAYETLKTEAEKHYDEKSYARAGELYAQAKTDALPPDEARWVRFRRADTQWRAQAATNTADDTKYEQARAQLEILVRDTKRDEEKDRVWVEVQESLGDFWWTRGNSQNWGEAWKYYQPALDWWAGQSDLDAARNRYLNLVWKLAAPPWAQQYYEGGYYGNYVSLPILENVLKIARTPNDQAQAHYFLAMALRQTGDWPQRARVAGEFEAALRAGRQTDWYDDALYLYANWIASYGQITQQENGAWQQRADYVKALELYRRLTREFQKGETRYYDQAQQQIENITRPVLGVSASNVFLPDSEIQFNLNWRNLKCVEFTLYRVDLPRDARFTDANQSAGAWAQAVSAAGRDKIKSWTRDTKDDGTYTPGSELARLDARLQTGAYLLQAEGGGQKAQDVILVTDAALVLKTSGQKALIYFSHALTGAPVAGARVKLWSKIYENSTYKWQEFAGETRGDGLAVFDLPAGQYRYEFLAAAALENRQAFSAGYGNYGYQPANQPQWRIYAYTDRPAYRPNETAQWKFTARQYANQTYTTPANQTIEYQINDPKGVKVAEGKAALNLFGSAWGSLNLTPEMPLGAYQIQFWDDGRRNGIGNAQLFRLEEYKLPEYKVSVSTPAVEGRKKAFRLGENVEVSVKAEFYFGGAVTDAEAEIVVYQRPFYHYWRRPREFSWYYDDLAPRNYYGGNGQIVRQEKLKTDAKGEARLTFETPNNGQDLEYYVEARVTDASRREITGSDTVRVTRQRYYVYARPDHNLYRPQDLVKVNFKSLDANSNPVTANGEVKVTRDFYEEVWLDPAGKEVKGDELRRLREQYSAQNRPFPPLPEKDKTGWTLKFSDYRHEEISTQKLATDDKGDAVLSFTPPREGFYRVAWSSPDKGASPVQAQAAVWVTTNRTTELGYRYGGLQIITDKDTYRVGERAPVMLTSYLPNRYVLFSVEGDDLDSYQVVHLDGASQLIETPIEAKHTPNIFLSAAMVSERQLFTDTKQLIVPPAEHFLNVEVKPDREQYQPREEGTLNITTRDHAGRPVSAEVALGLIDESVLYIQQDIAGDPRQFYFGAKRQRRVSIQSTFQQKAYAKLVENADKQLVDERFERLQRLADLSRGPVKKEAAGAKDGDYRLSDDEIDRVGAERGQNFAIDGLSPRESGTLQVAGLPVNGRRVVRSEMRSQDDARNEQAPEPAVQVRSDFRSTAFWQPDVTTDANGAATVKIKYPDSLTRWKATARVVTADDKFGVADAATRTKQPLIVRLQAPRFFVVGDTATVSAVINNNTDAPLQVAPKLDAQGVTINGLMRDGKPIKGEAGPVAVPPNGEARVDWSALVTQAGPVKLKTTARAQNSLADAMEREYTAHEHGVEKFVSKSGKLRGAEATIKLDIPRERKPETTNLTVQVAPSMAVTMLDALPYLIDYPYGCVEQTMSRFLPAAITAKTLRDLGLSPEDAMAKVFGGIEPQNAKATHPKGKRDLRQLEAITKQGLDRIYSMQHADGGWGWWKEGDSDHFMTAYVVWGLTLARDAGIKIKDDALNNAVAYLDKELVEEEANPDTQAWLLHALASRKPSEPSAFQAKAFTNLWNQRDKLNAYTRALLALSAHYFGYADKAQTLIRNLENGVKIDNAPDVSIVQRGEQTSNENVIGTAHWGADGLYYRWSEGGVEATSFALRALLAIDPQNKLIEPVTNWLIKNRRGAQWSNTRDTAITVLTFNDYLRVTREAQGALGYEITVNGQQIAAKYLTAADALAAPSRFAVSRELLRDGANEIKIRRVNGNGAIYFSANAQYFSLEEPVKAAGNEIFARREYYKLTGRPTLLKGYIYDRVPLRDGETVNSGDRVQVVLTIEAKNNYEYLLFEDLKPAGLEAVQLRSGEPLYARELKSGSVQRKFGAGNPNVATGDYTNRSSFVYQELRDRKVALFIGNLPEGVWEIRYDLRAETPGQYHALPLLGHAMYVPEIRCNDEETRIQVTEKNSR
jgi:hypothetical protein